MRHLRRIRAHIGAFVAIIAKKIGPHVSKKRLLLVGAGTFGVLVVGLAASFYWPRSVTFSYSQPTCFTNPMLLPTIIPNKQSTTFKATLAPSFTIAGYPIYSHRTCITPLQPPTDKNTEVIVLGNIVKKSIRVNTGGLPTLQNLARFDQPVSAKDPLIFNLDRADRIFEYQLEANGIKVPCAMQGRALSCDATTLGLAQSTRYDLTLNRLFRGAHAKIVLQRSFTTVEAVAVTAASLGANQTVYDVPSQLTLTLNKTIKSFSGVRLYQLAGDTRQEVPTTADLQDTTITVHFTKPLTRNVSFILTVEQVTAPDGAYLPTAYSLPFKTSGGPKVVGVSIGSSKIQPPAKIVLTFDSALSAKQAIAQFVRLDVNGAAAAITASASGRTVTLTPQSGIPRCAGLTVSVLDGLQNEFGISGGSAWRFNSRTVCQTVFSIGASVLGRGITGYSFGTGPSKIIFVGTTHGDEKSSTATLNKWIDYLESNAARIPANRTAIVIPNINPDGYAASRRTNAHSVDLNRNFPANDWKSGVTMPDKTYNANGGGSAPLSEPESRALANYVLGQNPRLVLTYHAAAGVVIPNDSGDSDALARVYDQKSNVAFASYGETDSIFNYDTTGAFEDWLHDKHGIPAILVELWTKSNNEFAKHQDAMWAMITIP